MSDRQYAAPRPNDGRTADRRAVSEGDGYSVGRELPHLRLFNVKYSPNLGDGLIAECLERGLAAMGGGDDVLSIDLAGRVRYGQRFAGRAQIISILDRMPKALRRQFIRPLLAAQVR